MKLNQFGRLEIYLFNYGNSKCKIINYCRSPRFFLSKKVLALLKTPYYFISVFRPQSYFYFSILVVFTSQEIRVRYVLCSVDELNNFSAFLFCFSIFCFSYFIFVFSFFLPKLSEQSSSYCFVCLWRRPRRREINSVKIYVDIRYRLVNLLENGSKINCRIILSI